MSKPAFSSRHLVAPELAPVLEFLPQIDFACGAAPYRIDLFEGKLPQMPADLETVDREERFIAGPDGAPDVRLLIYRPPGTSQTPRPAVMNVHGGGYVMGAPDHSDGANRALALAMDCIVVAPAYRLAPETAWPGALEDCYAALCWIRDNARELGIDPARLAISGESAGGGHAAALAIHARDQGGPAICFQMLSCPMLDDRTGPTTTSHAYCGEFGWTAEMNQFGWRSMLGREPGGSDVPDKAVPAREPDLRGLPPTCIVIGALDLFLEESLEYVRRLSRAGVPVELHVIPGAFHGFSLAEGAPQAEQALMLERQAMARALGVSALPRRTGEG